MVVVPVVIAPLKLVEVAVKVLHADLVEGSYDAPLEQGPHSLDAVGVHVPQGPLFHGVVDGLMAGLLTSRAAPAGTTRLAGWLDGNADILGRKYVSELWRNYRR